MLFSTICFLVSKKVTTFVAELERKPIKYRLLCYHNKT